MRLASFALCVRSNRHRSQVERVMFTRPYTYHLRTYGVVLIQLIQAWKQFLPRCLIK
jgi:hypothetical protein